MNRSRAIAAASLHCSLMMIRKIAVFAFIIALSTNAFSADPQPTPSKDDSKIDYDTWNIPWTYFSTTDPSNKDGLRKPPAGFVLEEGHGSERYDAIGYLKNLGVEFPPGSMAYYDRWGGVLVVGDTQANLHVIDTIFGILHDERPPQVHVNISMMECALPSKPLPPDQITYSDIVHLPATSVKLLDYITATAKSGERTLAWHKHNPVVTKSEQPAGEKQNDDSKQNATAQYEFKAWESGSVLEVEPVIGPDGEMIDTSLVYQYRSPATKEKQVESLKITISFFAWEGYPVVIHISPALDEGKFIVVIARVSVVNSGGWKLPHTDWRKPVSTTAPDPLSK